MTITFDEQEFAGNPLNFNLVDDVFPPNSRNGVSPDQGLLLDSTGAPFRFDTPSTLSSNSATIDDTTPNPLNNNSTPRLILTDDDDRGNFIVFENGDISRFTGTETRPFSFVSGRWGAEIAAGGLGRGGGIYFLSSAQTDPATVTEPSTMAMFGFALLVLCIAARRHTL